MMLLEEVMVCGGVSFHLPCTSRVGEGIRTGIDRREFSRVASNALLSQIDPGKYEKKEV
jgi:hypothetical protein